MNLMILGIIFMLLAFLSGSIPYGFLYAKMRGVDIRKVGSGNIGSTNILRQFGFWGGFIPVFILDVLKGFIPVFLFVLANDHDSMTYQVFEILVGLMAILGHTFTPFLGFKGGKGVATTAGVLAAWSPPIFLTVLIIFLTVLFTFGKKIIGRASLVAATILPFLPWIIPTSPVMKGVLLLIGVLVLYLHKKNLKEWISGEDLAKKLAKKKEQ